MDDKQPHQHHVSNILDDVLDEPKSQVGYHHPIILDYLMAICVLIAMGGFTVGLIKLYIAHHAQESIDRHEYKAAISILEGSPLRGIFDFTTAGNDTQELLAQALYLDAMQRLDVNQEDRIGINELDRIKPSSKFFATAQEIVKVHTKPTGVLLEGGASHTASPAESRAHEKQPLFPDEPKSP